MKKLEMKDILHKNVMDYAKYTITDRAIPNISDGMKNIHRRIIWSMYIDRLTFDNKRTKSVNAVGSVLRFSPHGDSSVYDACVRLANDSVMIPLIDGKGSFSSTTTRDIEAGASRYTEMRLAPITQEVLKDINNNTVNMVNNYDDSRLEPTDLPVTFPLILCNPNTGIAVGISSNICSFNLSEVIDNTINIINDKECELLVPDFPTSAVIEYNEDILRSINTKGTGTIYLRARYHSEGNSIVITEIPYTTTREAIIESIIDLVRKGKIKEVIDVNDYSGVDGLNITIEVKNNTDINILMAKLYKMTPLRSAFSCNFTALWKNKPITLGTDGILEKWLKFRRECIVRGIAFDIEKSKKELNKLYGLKMIIEDLDKSINLVCSSSSEKEAINNLSKELSLNGEQAEYISGIKLVNINKEWVMKRISSIEKIEKDISNLENIVNSEQEVNKIIIQQLGEIKRKYGQPRKTQIIYDEDIFKIEKEDMVQEYNCMIYITKDGYFKKVPLTSLRNNSVNTTKDGDYITHELEATNKSVVLVFTNKGVCHKIYLHEMQDNKPSNLGVYLYNQLTLESNEKIIGIVTTKSYLENIYFAFENGKVACVFAKQYRTKNRRSKLENALNVESKLVNVFKLNSDTDILCKSDINKVLVVNSSKFNAKVSKNTQGIQVLKSKNSSKMIKCYPLINIENKDTNYDYYKIDGITGTGKYEKKEDSIYI